MPSPLNLALTELARRDLSPAELHLLLARKGFLPAEIEETRSQLTRWNLLSDERAALAHLRKRTGRTARGDALLKEELLQRGIPEAVADAVLARTLEAPESKRALTLLRTKYPKGTELGKAARFLASRGFSEEAIESALNEARAEGLLPPEEDL